MGNSLSPTNRADGTACYNAPAPGLTPARRARGRVHQVAQRVGTRAALDAQVDDEIHCDRARHALDRGGLEGDVHEHGGRGQRVDRRRGGRAAVSVTGLLPGELAGGHRLPDQHRQQRNLMLHVARLVRKRAARAGRDAPAAARACVAYEPMRHSSRDGATTIASFIGPNDPGPLWVASPSLCKESGGRRPTSLRRHGPGSAP